MLMALFNWGRSSQSRTSDNPHRCFEAKDIVEHGRMGTCCLDYELMKLVVASATVEAFLADEAPLLQEYAVRRNRSTEWEVKLTDHSFDNYLAYLIRQTAAHDESADARAPYMTEIRQLGDRPTWHPLSAGLVGSVESQYQRFLRYRENC